jgi:mono/diheme cytochrome c family protein
MRVLIWLSMSALFLMPLRAAQHPSDSKTLSKTEKAGEALFLQRCSVCHLGYPLKFNTYGPALYKELVAERGEEFVRRKIMEGSPLMPGWKYTLKSTDVDGIIAYLETVKKEDLPVAVGSDVGSTESDK